MATSPSFNWPEPDNSDLVKNGALAIRTAVDAIDTSMTDLLGGTTGQVLTKASGTDMDFTWSAGATVPDSYGYAAGKNKIINGDFNVWQRGTSFTNPSAGTFTCDRYSWDSVSMTGSITRQAFTAGTAPVAGYEGTFFARLDITSGTQYGELVQKIENARTFAGQTITVSFWAKLNSGASGWQVNVVQNFGTGGSPSSAVLVGQSAFTPTASWQRFTYTVAVPSVSGKTFGSNNNSFLAATIQKTSSTASQLDTWGWQVEAGSSATTFQTATGTIQGELSACQRYYYRNVANGAFTVLSTLGAAETATSCRFTIQHPVTMRIAPTTIDFSTLSVYSPSGGTTSAISTFTNVYAGTQVNLVAAGVTGLTANAVYMLYSNNSTSAYFGFSAEL
jgi:hypothetical protein